MVSRCRTFTRYVCPSLGPHTLLCLTTSLCLPHAFLQALNAFFQWLERTAATSNAPPTLPPELQNIDQLKVLLDTLPDYHGEETQPSYVLAIPCRPIVDGLSSMGFAPGLTVPCGSQLVSGHGNR